MRRMQHAHGTRLPHFSLGNDCTCTAAAATRADGEKVDSPPEVRFRSSNNA
jgi:hypothetical protein